VVSSGAFAFRQGCTWHEGAAFRTLALIGNLGLPGWLVQAVRWRSCLGKLRDVHAARLALMRFFDSFISNANAENFMSEFT
jgi:hypothetical protein